MILLLFYGFAYAQSGFSIANEQNLGKHRPQDGPDNLSCGIGSPFCFQKTILSSLN